MKKTEYWDSWALSSLGSRRLAIRFIVRWSRVSYNRHYWYFELGNSLLWVAVLIIEECSTALRASSHQFLVNNPTLDNQMSRHCQISPGGWGVEDHIVTAKTQWLRGRPENLSHWTLTSPIEKASKYLKKCTSRLPTPKLCPSQIFPQWEPSVMTKPQPSSQRPEIAIWWPLHNKFEHTI